MDNFDLYEWNQKRRSEQLAMDEAKVSIDEKKKKKKKKRFKRIAKRKYDTWPSAYASGAVVRCRKGEIWKGEK